MHKVGRRHAGFKHALELKCLQEATALPYVGRLFFMESFFLENNKTISCENNLLNNMLKNYLKILETFEWKY